ncbi:uncharacterized protein OGAPODRAFT_36698, partial [Ogataea polymorpha]|uniref:uncharacterized protein n=1 Tax=Ogataea polymorpha TaxID=460523 RepID=UPI0007F448BC
EDPLDPALEYAVVDPAQPNMPYGDGSDKVFGMENFGYTCYIASILQTLYYTTSFRHQILAFPERDAAHPRKRKLRYGMSETIFTALKDVFECITENVSKVGIVSAQQLVEVVKKENEMFRSSMHQDAHEFLNFLLNNVIEALDNYCNATGAETDIHRLFEGLLTSETKCLSCETVSTRDELFLDLSIDLQPNTSITHCLKMFSQSEMLTESNKFYCESCHSLQEAAKTIKLKKLPKILALHLKRFKYAEELGRNVKLFYRVEYTKTLRIFNTTEGSAYADKMYELYAVVVHIGGGPSHGHYVAIVKTDRFGWLLFDDETVECVDENFVYRFFGDGPGLATAYLLFYR